MKKIIKKVLSLLLIITMVTVHFIAPIRVFAEETVRVTIDVNGGNELTQNYIDGIKGHTLMEMVGDLEEGPLLYSFLNLRKPRTYLEAVINSDTEEPIDPENDPIDEDTSIKFLWEQSELYDGAVSVQVDAPHIGDEYEVNEVMEPGQLVIAYYDQAPTPSMTTDFEVFNIDFDNRRLLYYTDDCKNAGLDPYDNAECLQPFAGTIEEGETYYISFVISINDKYYMTNDISEVLTVNGEEPQFLQAAGYENEDFKAANVIIEMQAVEGNGNNEEGEFTITYDTDGGTNIAPEYVHDNEKAPQPNPDPEKEHYIFGGWYSDPERNNPYDFDDPVHEDRTIYAKWEEKNISITTSPNSINYGEIQANPEDHIQRVVTVTNNGNTNVTLTLTNPTSDGPFGSLGFNPIDLDVGASIDVTLIVNKNADKAGIPGEYSGNYVFTASDCGGDGEFSVNVPATVTIVQNTPQVHTVTFDTDGGTSIGSVTVNHGDTVSAPEIIPHKDNYEFAMWCSDETKTQPYNFGNAVTSDITIYAKYNPVQQGGNDPESALISLTPTSVDFGTFTVGSESDLYRTVKVSNDSQVDVEITVSSPTEQGPFYALEIQPFVVEAGQEQNVNLIVDHGSSKASLPGTYNGQYVFNYKEVGAESGEEMLVNATVVVEEAEPATPEKVTVSFETYGGTPVPEAREIDKGSAVSAPTTNPAKDNYEFDAWCSDETATQPYDFTQPVNSSMTLYAKYNPVQQGGTSSGNNDELVILDNTNNQDYNPEDDDADEGLTIRVSGELSDLIKIEVDGEEVSSSDVSLISGSTIATFAQSFLNTLSNGAHTVTFYFGSGNINATFNIQRTAANTNTTTNTTTTTQGTTNNSNNPGTNDNIVKWVSLFGVSVLALSGVVLLKKKL